MGDVTPEGPADKAGVKVGDVVLTLNGRTMRNARQLEAYIYRSPMKEKITLQVLRGKDRAHHRCAGDRQRGRSAAFRRHGESGR